MRIIPRASLRTACVWSRGLCVGPRGLVELVPQALGVNGETVCQPAYLTGKICTCVAAPRCFHFIFLRFKKKKKVTEEVLVAINSTRMANKVVKLGFWLV